MTDNQLLEKLKKDKNSGLSLAVDIYSGLLYKIAANVILPHGTREDVEECVSDSFLAFYGNIEKIDLEKASIKTYLAVITKRKAIDLRRTFEKNAVVIPLEDAYFYVGESNFTAANDAKSDLMWAIKSLGEPDKTIITRKFFLGEKAAEIGRHLNMSEEAVQKRIERAKLKLKTELGGVLNG